MGGMGSCIQKTLAKPIGLYRPRQPWKKGLFQALSDNWSYFEDHYEEQYLADYGPLTTLQKKTFQKFLECGILSYGFARARCPDCSYEFAVAYSCQKKGLCPSCQAKRTELFSRFVLEEVVEEIPHRQLVFTLPKILRRFFIPAKRRTRLVNQGEKPELLPKSAQAKGAQRRKIGKIESKTGSPQY